MKKLYEFTLNKEIELKETISEKNESGEEISVTKTVKKQIPQKIVIKKPTRLLFDEAELFYGVRLSEGIKAGLLTRALLSKRFTNDGGVFSEIDKEEYTKLYMKIFELQNDFQKISLKEDKDRSEEENIEYKALIKQITEIREKIQDYEFAQASLFDQTAENRARNKTIMWWVLNLSHQEDESGNLVPIFGEGSFEDRIMVYDKLEEMTDSFFEKLIKKLVLFVSFWYMGRASTVEEFEKLFEIENKENGA